MKTIAERYAGTRVRYTPPKCHDERHNGEGGRVDQVCQHAAGYHEPSRIERSNASYFGLVRRRDGAVVFKVEDFTKRRAIPSGTRENIAACAALGLSYWSGHPAAGHVWAVDNHQQAHAVKIDRKASKAMHACSLHTRFAADNKQCLDSGRHEFFLAPDTLEETLALF